MNAIVTRRAVVAVAFAAPFVRFAVPVFAQSTPEPYADDEVHGEGEMHDDHGDAMGGTGAAYMTIANAGDAPVRLVGVTTAAAQVVEVHEMAEEDGVMRMRPLHDGLEIPAGGSVALEPAGYHLMMMGLTADLLAGESFGLELAFEGAEPVAVTLTVPIVRQSDAPAADADPVTVGDVTVSGAWSRPAPALGGAMGGHGATPEADHGAGTGAAYLVIANAGAEPDRLLAATSHAAEVVEIHEIVDDAGVMRMRPLADGVEIPAGGEVSLEPGGLHVMLIGLTGALHEGDEIDLALEFERAGEVEVGVVVRRDARATEPAAAEPVVAGDLTIAEAWARSAPAMGGEGHGEAEDDADADMHGDAAGAATPAP